VLRLPGFRAVLPGGRLRIYFPGRSEISTLIDAARAGRELRASYRARGIDTVSAFSLSGFVAGLVFMDEVQGRVGREDALQAERSGDRPRPRGADPRNHVLCRYSVPDPRRIRRHASCGLRRAGRGPVRRLGGFEARFDGDVAPDRPALRAGRRLQSAYAFWERTGSNFRRVPLPIMTDEGPSTTGIAWNISWDQDRELTGFFKGRGLGDCGSFNRWAWTERTEGHAFVLKEARVKSECDGDDGGGAENWPAVWPPE
jgi:hypothetical protein